MLSQNNREIRTVEPSGTVLEMFTEMEKEIRGFMNGAPGDGQNAQMLYDAHIKAVEDILRVIGRYRRGFETADGFLALYAH